MLIKKTQQLLSANEPIIGYTKDQKFNALIEIKCNFCLRQMSYELILIIFRDILYNYNELSENQTNFLNIIR